MSSFSPRIAVAWPKDDYLTALARAGADIKVLDPATDRVADVIAHCDGLLLTGGADVDPIHYGEQERHPTLSLEPDRDDYEFDLARAAMAANLPMLAICRGVQLLNVAAGGTLFQDLPSQSPSSVDHRVRQPLNQAVHSVAVTPGSRLAALVTVADTHDIEVNSRHHQAIRTVAPGFAVAAVAPDGIVEGIERQGEHFCIGVQWHPENFWETGEFNTLFEGFVEAARRRSP
jgi:putative glutamine amidotransferase